MTLPFIKCLTDSGKLFNIQFPHLQNGHNDSSQGLL